MNLDYNGLISNDLINHTKNIVINEEKIKYYIDDTYGWGKYNRYTEIQNNQLITLLSVVYIVKYKKINQYYAEIFLFCVHIINFIAEKIINITLNINLFLNIY